MRRPVLLAYALVVTLALSACGALTQGEGVMRSGWFRFEPKFAPQAVNKETFGELSLTQLDGEIYAQPVVYRGMAIVVTEKNQVAGVDAATGDLVWSRSVGTPWQAADLACYDLAPNVGITGTPAVDATTETVYFVSKHYAAGTSGPARQQMHAVDIMTGAERAGFPVTIAGAADNDPATTFNATTELQRPGLLLMDGVVYAAFGGHCDREPYNGWVVGVSTAGRLTTRWAASTGPGRGEAGIWQSGGALVSDRPGSILLATGNGPTPGYGPARRTPMPTTYGQSVVRLDVGGEGKLRPSDWFTPSNGDALNLYDGDVGAGGPSALPDEFGTPSHRHLLTVAGKEGYIYLVDRDRLGGMGQGPTGDAIVAKIGSHGGVWSKSAAWPGDGGWLYLPTASPVPGIFMPGGTLHVYRHIVDGAGNPTFVLSGETTDVFGFGSSAPLITSDGTTDGTALVWITHLPTSAGEGAELRAYDPVPVDGTLQLRWSAPIGRGTKFAAPAIFDGKIYLGNRDGELRIFGATNTLALTAPRTVFPTTQAGQGTTLPVTFTATRPLTITGSSFSRPEFSAPATPTFPVSLPTGGTITIPVRFTGTTAGLVTGELRLTTDAGTWGVALVARASAAPGAAALIASQVSFPVSSVSGRTVSSAVLITNTSAQPVTFGGMFGTPPPFTTTGLPPIGRTLAPGESFGLNVTFSPPATPGTYRSAVYLAAGSQLLTIPVAAEVREPGLLAVSSSSIEFGEVPLGTWVEASFMVTNTGDAPVTVTRSKPPVWDPHFRATTSLPEGAQVPPGVSWSETVRFTPTAIGAWSATWEVNGDDGAGVRSVTFHGTGTPAP